MHRPAWWRRCSIAWRRWRRPARLARAARARHDRLLRTLPIPIPFEARAFCAALAARRGRPIALVSRPLGGHFYGLVISTAERDTIVYERDTTALHQQQIIVHEACHLILDHRRLGALDAELLPLARHILGGGFVRHVQGRGVSRTPAERAAEALASRIIEEAAALQTEGQLLAPRITAALTRLRPFDHGRADR